MICIQSNIYLTYICLFLIECKDFYKTNKVIKNLYKIVINVYNTICSFKYIPAATNGWCGNEHGPNWIEIDFPKVVGIGGIVIQQPNAVGGVNSISIEFQGIDHSLWQQLGTEVRI